MMTFIKRLGIFLLIFFLFNFIFLYLYEKPIRQSIVNKTNNKYLQWSEIQSSTRYDVIILGSSRGYCAYNPLIIDSLTCLNSFNMCTGSQDIIQTYYILKEILRFQKPKLIIYDITLPSFDNTSDFFQITANASFMTETGKFDMIINGYGIAGIANYILPILKHKLYIKNDIVNFINSNNTDNNPNEEKTKLIKGYLLDSTVLASDKIKDCPELYNFENTHTSRNKLEYYFDKFIQYCKSNDIKLICVTAPYPPSRLNLNSKDTVSNYFKKVCEKHSITYYDFNYLVNNKYANTDFVDCLHMNYKGATKVSKQLAELLLYYKSNATGTIESLIK